MSERQIEGVLVWARVERGQTSESTEPLVEKDTEYSVMNAEIEEVERMCRVVRIGATYKEGQDVAKLVLRH